jgi:hypothetical protein
MRRNAQLSSIDIIISVIAVMLFLSIVIVYFNTVAGGDDSNRIYRAALLELSPILDGYAVNESAVASISGSSSSAVRDSLLSPIGLDNSQYDVCVVLKKGSELSLLLNGTVRLTDGCDNPRNICPSHTKTNSYIKPVIYQNAIYEMNMVVCEP